MIERALSKRVEGALDQFPCVAINGLRQVGKTSLARLMADRLRDRALFVSLGQPDARSLIDDPVRFLTGQVGRLVILDELQSAPHVLDALRGQIELRAQRGVMAGSFLILVSESASLRRSLSEKLAGHLTTLELGPFQANEILQQVPEASAEAVENAEVLDIAEVVKIDPIQQQTEIWLRGGMPGSYLAASAAASYAWRSAFMDAAIAREFSLNGQLVPIQSCRRAWMIAAHNHGYEAPFKEFAEGLGWKKDESNHFIDTVCDSQYFRRLPRWYSNSKKRMESRHKLYLRDSGLLHALLGLQDHGAVDGHVISGRSWEGHVLEGLASVTELGVELAYFKTDDDVGELDIVLAKGDRLWVIEAKKGTDPSLTKEFYRAIRELKPERTLGVYRGTRRYELGGFVEMMSLQDAIREVSSL